MGGYGSTRWGYHWKKTQVEDCLKLTIKYLKPYLWPGNRRWMSWLRGDVETGKINYHVWGDDRPTALRLMYTIGPRSDNPEEVDYLVSLTTTPLPWGGVRYWFVCPLDGCNRRVGCLYLPPGGKYFGCRHCYKLTYESQQEGDYSRHFFGELAGVYQDVYPGATLKDIRALLKDKFTPHMRELLGARALEKWKSYDPYKDKGYMTRAELLQESGLTEENLTRLESVRLIVADSKDGRYRPKLVGWSKKLVFLLGEGWSVEEIKRWSKGRWKTENPRQWPPERYNHDK